MNRAEGVWIKDGELWGKHGGALEFVSLEVIHDVVGDKCAVLRFTDHDVVGVEDAPVDKIFYEITVPLSDWVKKESSSA